MHVQNPKQRIHVRILAIALNDLHVFAWLDRNQGWVAKFEVRITMFVFASKSRFKVRALSLM